MNKIIYKAVRSFPKINYNKGKGEKPRINLPTVTLALWEITGNRKTIDLEEVSGPQIEVSFTYDVWNLRQTDCCVCGGSGSGVSDLLNEFFPDDKEAVEIGKWADKLHLNAAKAGTRAQMGALSAYSAAWDKYGRPAYIADKENVRPDLSCWHAEHEDGYFQWSLETLRKVGLEVDRGYRYGTSWLIEIIPDRELRRLVDLFPNPSVNKLAEHALSELMAKENEPHLDNR